MTAKTAKPKRQAPKRPKQQMIPGTEPEVIPEITAKAEEYVEWRDARMDAGRMEVKTGGELLELMKKHKRTAYEYNGKIVELGAQEKVKVRKLKGQEDNGEA